MAGRIFRATGGGVAMVNGRKYVIQPGMTVREGHPLVGSGTDGFELLTPDLEWDEPEPKRQSEPEPKQSASVEEAKAPRPRSRPSATGQ